MSNKESLPLLAKQHAINQQISNFDLVNDLYVAYENRNGNEIRILTRCYISLSDSIFDSKDNDLEKILLQEGDNINLLDYNSYLSKIDPDEFLVAFWVILAHAIRSGIKRSEGLKSILLIDYSQRTINVLHYASRNILSSFSFRLRGK